jgi:hypothetical protein
MEQSQPSVGRKAREPESQQTTQPQYQNRSLPSKSMNTADAVFKNFNASGFPKGAKPANYVEPADGPAAVQSAQRRIIAQQLDRLSAMETPDGGLTLALPESDVEKLLPSLNAEESTIELGDVLNVIAQYMRGTEFYADGNPVLNRLALRSRARELIAAIKQEVAATAPQKAKAAAQRQGEKK